MKCLKCVNHKLEGNMHSCPFCSGKVVFGKMQEDFLEYCEHYVQTAESLQKDLMQKKLNLYKKGFSNDK